MGWSVVTGEQPGAEHYREPVSTIATLPTTAQDGEIRLVYTDASGDPGLFRYFGGAWAQVADGGASGLSNPVTIAQGGTGQTTADRARALGLDVRPYDPAALAVSTLYVSNAGNDTTGDGTVGLPYLTIQRAIETIPIAQAINVNIQVLGGTFALPAQLGETNFTTIRGTVTVQETRTVTGVTSFSAAAGLRFTIDGGPFLDDALRGRLIQYDDGNRGWIFQNAGNIVRASKEGTSLVAPTSIQILTLATLLQWPTSTAPVIKGSVELNFADCRLDQSDATLFIIATDQVDFTDCSVCLLRPQIGGYGRAAFNTCYICSFGNATDGVLKATNGGFLRFFDGTVVDADVSAAVGEQWIDTQAGSIVTFERHLVIRGLQALGFAMDGNQAIVQGGQAATTRIEFFDCDAAFVINDSGEGTGGSYQFPHLYGTLNAGANYAVEACEGAQVVIGPSSALGTNGGAGPVNAVSADCGVTNTAFNDDGTIIEGGSPAFERPGRVQVELALGLVTASSTYRLPAASRILEARLVVTTPYSAGATITLGDVAVPTRIMTSAQNNPQIADTYIVLQSTNWPTLEAVRATVAGAPAVGAATVFVEYSQILN